MFLLLRYIFKIPAVKNAKDVGTTIWILVFSVHSFANSREFSLDIILLTEFRNLKESFFNKNYNRELRNYIIVSNIEKKYFTRFFL